MIPPIIAAVLIAFQFTYPVSGPGRQGHISSCAIPSAITSLWATHNAGITCYPGGVSCTNTANIFSVPDTGSVGGNTVAPVAQATSPAYTTAGIGTTPVFTYTSTNHDALITSTSIVPTGSFGMYAVVQPPPSGLAPIFTSDNPLSSAQLNSIAWYFSNGKPTLDASFIANVFSDSNNYGGVWAIVFFTNNFTTGVYTYGHCSAGTCTTDGSGTRVQAWSNPSNSIGSYPAASAWYQGSFAEIGLFTTTTGLGAYTFCQYPTI